jgi:hypothetical protein
VDTAKAQKQWENRPKWGIAGTGPQATLVPANHSDLVSSEYGKVPLGYATYKIPQSDESVEIRDESAFFFETGQSKGKLPKNGDH